MKNFTVQDLYLHQRISELHCVPGLDMAVAAVQSVEQSGNNYLSCLWTFPADGNAPRQLTYGPGLDQAPRWSPRGNQLAFLSNRAGGAQQLYVMPLDGGEARQIGPSNQTVSQLCWMPDGQSLLATASVTVDPNLRGQRGEVQPQVSGPAEVCWRLPYKSDGVGYLLQREFHLFRAGLDGSTQQLTNGAFDVMGFEASPDGRQIAYSRTREGRYAHCSDLWMCDGEGENHRRLTFDLATVNQPVWSPDGRWIAFAGAKTEGDGQTSLYLFETSSGKVSPMGPYDLEVADPQSLHWSPDGSELLLARAWHGRHHVVAVSLANGQLTTRIAGDRQFGAFGWNHTHFFFAADTPVLPSEMFVCDSDGHNERQVSLLNAWWKERKPLQLESRQFTVPDAKGGHETIEGWLLRAQDAQGPLPLLCDVHGGPASYALIDYETTVYRQSLCADGWAVLMLNAVGSSSFGREFCERLSGHWGEFDLPQHLAAVKQLQAEGICDERIAIAGKSYGGFFTSWAIGHTDTFRAAVVMAPVGNIETHYGTSDGGYYADPLYVGSAPRFDRQRAREMSPLQYVEKATTPTLFMQGKEDERCPKCQTEELFVSLYRAGETPAEMVLYPGETHGFLGSGKPSCREDASSRIKEWIGRYTGQRVSRPGSMGHQTANAEEPQTASA
ncbi:MAG: peptidase [Polaromonas sp.]|nr:peptidase [Polaromonas sp.]